MKGALIGLGRISNNHKNCFIEYKNEVNLVAVCDLKQDKINKFINEYEKATGICPKTTLNYKELITENLDFVVVCVESGSHYEVAKYFLENNVSCLVEKPLTLSGKQCKELENLAKEKNLICGVCFQNRYNKAVTLVKRAIEDGRFGKISNISARMVWGRDINYYMQDSWRGKWISDGGAFFNQAIHCIDIVQCFADASIENIDCKIANRFHEYIEVEDYGNMNILFSNGIIANIEATVNCVDNFEEKILIVGEKGFAEIGGVAMNEIKEWKFADNKEYDKEVKNLISNNLDVNTSENIEKQIKVYGNGHLFVYKDYIKSLKQKQQFSINFKEASKSVNMILTAYLSGKLNKRINFKTNLSTKMMKNFKFKI